MLGTQKRVCRCLERCFGRLVPRRMFQYDQDSFSPSSVRSESSKNMTFEFTSQKLPGLRHIIALNHFINSVSEMKNIASSDLIFHCPSFYLQVEEKFWLNCYMLRSTAC
ncbi:hypothetical protein M378DRAFT_345919 [Amanita muscaria Koide BX008]|uniref:Uncharacterized protein n=1 Tax=Amanita muscaria (strain Koide BX008) TaxID=946122 RepID=A0A0C2WP83_AMAMK|nr:hypothetical protein M378DRAFT_345919 [Amanita muscaria Koide BX008]